MTAPAIAGTPLKERLQGIIDRELWGVLDRETPVSEAEQARLDEDEAVLSGEYRAIDAAPTGDMARMAYLRCFLDLGGISVEQAIDALVAIRLERRLEVLEAAGDAR